MDIKTFQVNIKTGDVWVWHKVNINFRDANLPPKFRLQLVKCDNDLVKGIQKRDLNPKKQFFDDGVTVCIK
jgi:hypothetical protein